MSTIDIRINEWSKYYQPRKKIKSTSWLRLQNNFWRDPEFFHFSGDEKMVWVAILSMASEKMSGDVCLNLEQIATFMRVKRSVVDGVCEWLEKRGMISILSHSSDELVTQPTQGDVATERNVTNGKNVKKNTNAQNPKVFSVKDFDIDPIYLLYPRKLGKKKGYEQLKKILTSKEKVDQFKTSVINFASEMRSEGRDKTKIAYFDTYVRNQWEDYLVTEKSASDKWLEK